MSARPLNYMLRVSLYTVASAAVDGSFLVGSLYIVAPAVCVFVFGLCFYAVLSALYGFAIILLRKIELVAYVNCLLDVL